MNTIDFNIDKYSKFDTKSLQIDDKFIKFKNNTLIFQNLDFSNIYEIKFYQEFVEFNLIDGDDEIKFINKNKFKNLYSKVIPTKSDGEEIIKLEKLEKVEFYSCILNNIFIDKGSNLKDLTFDGCGIKGEFSIQDNKNEIELSSTSSTFENGAYFQRSVFNNINLKTSIFKEFVSFDQCEFHNIILDYVTFEGNVFFKNTKIDTKLDLEYSIFVKEVNFLNIKNKDGEKLESKNIVNRETARIIKHSFEKIGNIIEANKFYALEMELKRKELNNLITQECNTIRTLLFKILPEFIVFWAHKISSNHSQSWTFALFWIIIVSVFGICESNIFTSLEILFKSNDKVQLIFDSFYKLLNIKETTNPILKLSMGYLVYQFIVSVRQNTRRK